MRLLHKTIFKLPCLVIFSTSFFSLQVLGQGPPPPRIPDATSHEIETWDEWAKPNKRLEKDSSKRDHLLEDEVEVGSPKIEIKKEEISNETVHYPAANSDQTAKNEPTTDEWGFPLPPGQLRRVIKEKNRDGPKSVNPGKPSKTPIKVKARKTGDGKENIVIKKKKIPGIKPAILVQPKTPPLQSGGGDSAGVQPFSLEALPKNPFALDGFSPNETKVDALSGFEIAEGGLWDFGLNGAYGSPLEYFTPEDLGLASFRSPLTPMKRRFLYDISGGVGLNQTRVFSTSSAIRLDDHIIGVAYERAQWLDTKTNTGKFVESFYADYCAAITLDSSWLSVQPCYRYGIGEGFWRERNELNQIVERQKRRNVLKSYGRFVSLLPIFSDQKIAVEGTFGYSEDLFLYGPYSQFWIKTPFLGLSIGVELYTKQRRALSLGFASGFLELD